MKCIPITWCALYGICPAILEIDIDDVLVAKIACLGVNLAKSSKILDLSTKSSFAAYMS